MENNLRYKFGKKVKLERNKRSLSQEGLAFLSKVSLTVIGQIERFEISTTVDTIEKLSKAFGIEPKELFDFSDIIE